MDFLAERVTSPMMLLQRAVGKSFPNNESTPRVAPPSLKPLGAMRGPRLLGCGRGFFLTASSASADQPRGYDNDAGGAWGLFPASAVSLMARRRDAPVSPS
jgi:hypothetical protein